MNLYEVIENLTKKDIYLIDVGAYKGEFSDSLLHNIIKIKHVEMYEPQQSSFEDLEKKYLDNKNIRIHNVAIGNENGTKEFFYYDEQGYKSSLLKPLEGGVKCL